MKSFDFKAPKLGSLYCSKGGGRNRTFSEDVDMRMQAPGVSQEDSYNLIIMQALEQHKRGDLNADEYKRVLSEVCLISHKLNK